MSLADLQSELTLLLDEIASVCDRYGYKATPTLLLRHPDGAKASILIGNDQLSQVVLCIAELGDIGNRSDMSPREAALKLITGAAKPSTSATE